ncbi:hypothetical protein LguiA_024147 [Lonicera macranthoides]
MCIDLAVVMILALMCIALAVLMILSQFFMRFEDVSQLSRLRPVQAVYKKPNIEHTLSLKSDGGRVGAVFIFHNHEGSILLASHDSRESCLDVRSAEAWTILASLQAVLKKNFHFVLVESDTLSGVFSLQSNDKLHSDIVLGIRLVLYCDVLNCCTPFDEDGSVSNSDLHRVQKVSDNDNRERSVTSRIGLGSRLLAKEDKAWVSDNGTFAFGFIPTDSPNQFQLAIWFAQLPGDTTTVWSAYLNSPVGEDAVLEFDTTGNLVLTDRDNAVWMSNTSGSGVQSASMSDNGNFILYDTNQTITWQSFQHPSHTLLIGQPLTASLELTSSKSQSQGGGYYTLKMLQQRTSLSLGLTYTLPEPFNNSPDSYTNYSFWSGPQISNVTGDVVAVLDEAGSFGIVYGSLSDGAVYVYKNDGDNGGLSSAANRSNTPSIFRRLTLETNGNLRLYRWDNDVNGSRQWVPEWAAVSNPCDIAGICGNGICNLDKSKTNASCACLPSGTDSKCLENSKLAGKCGPHRENLTSGLKIATVQQTSYYYSDSSVIANYSDIPTVSKCGDACLSDCECVASVYGLNEETAYCWVLRSLDFGGYEDPGSTLFVKVESNGSTVHGNGGRKDGDSTEKRTKVLVIPIVLSMSVLIGLLCCLLYISLHRRRYLKKALENSLIVSGAPMNFSYRDLHCRTSNFSQLLGTGKNE